MAFEIVRAGRFDCGVSAGSSTRFSLGLYFPSIVVQSDRGPDPQSVALPLVDASDRPQFLHSLLHRCRWQRCHIACGVCIHPIPC